MDDDERKDGGQAYPAAWGDYQNGGDYIRGMTLRDWFAGQALSGLCAYSGAGSALLSANPRAMAGTAYVWADAMLSARRNPNDT